MGEVPNDPVKSQKNLIEYKLKNLKGLLSKSELLKSTVTDTERPTMTKMKNLSMTEVFIVHGHDELAKAYEIARIHPKNRDRSFVYVSVSWCMARAQAI